MIDIHCHILPGLDDGPDSLDEALRMAEIAIGDGITHIIATPHANSQFLFDSELVRRRRNELQDRVGERLVVATGCDFHLSFENLQNLRLDPSRFTLNQKNYLLVELDEYSLPPTIEETLHQLHLAQIRPILTHPERNPWIRAKPERFYRWLHLGCYAQSTAQSLLGNFGSGAQRWVECWLDAHRIHFFATDAHNPTARPPRLHEAYEVVARRCGELIAQALFRDNPLAALEGRSLPYEPEQAESELPYKLPRRKRFFFF